MACEVGRTRGDFTIILVTVTSTLKRSSDSEKKNSMAVLLMMNCGTVGPRPAGRGGGVDDCGLDYCEERQRVLQCFRGGGPLLWNEKGVRSGPRAYTWRDHIRILVSLSCGPSNRRRLSPIF